MKAGLPVPPSVVDPISPALDRTKRILFQPFDIGKWLRLGFCAFLMSLAEAGCSGGSGGGDVEVQFGGEDADFEPVTEWIRDNFPLFIVIALVVTLVVLAIYLVLMWLGSRGNFMFLDGVVLDRGAVVEPWREYRREGNSLFLFRICLAMIALLLAGLFAAVCALIAWPDIQAREFGGFAVGAIASGVVLFLLYVLALAVVYLFLKDFVVPIMYLRRIDVMAAWQVFTSSMLVGNTGPFLLYFLMRIVIGMTVGVLTVMAFCFTCCLVAIPYVGSVILLPLTVVVQAYPLYFIEQFGPSWRVFPPDSDEELPVTDSPTPPPDNSF